MEKPFIIYEQPLNELVRVSLRLEHLFHQIDLCMDAEDTGKHIHAIIHLIIDLLNVLDRPDLKSKLTKEFNRFTAIFERLNQSPQISQEKLSHTLKELRHLTDHFLITPGKVGQSLRDNEFLANLRQNLLSPGGDSGFDAPYYHHWMHLPLKERQHDVSLWLKQFQEIRRAIELLLSIIRNSSEPQEIIAAKGFYYEPLDPQAPVQLIRVAFPAEEILYPEISAGRHRMSVRFVIPNMNNRPRQTPDDISFTLTICII